MNFLTKLKLYSNKNIEDIFNSFKGDPFLSSLFNIVPASREYKQRIKYCEYFIMQENLYNKNNPRKNIKKNGDFIEKFQATIDIILLKMKKIIKVNGEVNTENIRFCGVKDRLKEEQEKLEKQRLENERIMKENEEKKRKLEEDRRKYEEQRRRDEEKRRRELEEKRKEEERMRLLREEIRRREEERKREEEARIRRIKEMEEEERRLRIENERREREYQERMRRYECERRRKSGGCMIF